MSQTDSFIDEVTEEVRRDRLYATFRRWAWAGVALVVVVVGGTVWAEWSSSRDRAESEAAAVALREALEGGAAAPGPLGALATGGASLEALAEDGSADPRYRDLAALRQAAALPPEDARALLEPLARPGAPYRTLAQERLALVQAQIGDRAGALERLEALAQQTGLPAGQRTRVAQAIVALGGSV